MYIIPLDEGATLSERSNADNDPMTANAYFELGGVNLDDDEDPNAGEL